jgi:ribosomal protein L11 methyltransferase
VSGYLEVSCDCPPEAAEQLCYYITENMARGLVTEDDGEQVTIRFYLPQDDGGETSVRQFRDFLAESGLLGNSASANHVRVRPIAEIDWLNAYQRQFRSVIVDDIVIRSTWDDRDYPDKLEIVMDPRMAFGTGHHETTKLCLRQLREDLRPGHKLLDLGTGSGVLSILAAKLGAVECFCIDNDPEAAENAAENARLNQVADKLTVRLGSMELSEQQDYYDLVVSNLIYEGLLNLYDSLAAAAKPEGVIILSGILDTQEERFLQFLKNKGAEQVSVTRLNEWICVRIGKVGR